MLFKHHTNLNELQVLEHGHSVWNRVVKKQARHTIGHRDDRARAGEKPGHRIQERSSPAFS